MEEGIDTQNNLEKRRVEDGSEIPNSNGRLVVVKGEPKTPSRYLSDRVPSCHDNCKYGIQHSVEAKPWSAGRKKYIASGRKTKVSEEVIISVAGRKKSTSGSNDSPTSNLGEPETVMKDQLPEDANVPSDKTLLSFVETNVSMDHHPMNMQKEQSEQPSLPVQESPVGQKSREAEKSESCFGSGSKITSEGRSKQIKTSPIGGKRRSGPTSSPLSSKQYVKKSSSTTSKTAKNLKEVANLKIEKNVEEVKPEPTSNDNLQGKILNVDEPTTFEKSMKPTLACDSSNESSVSPSLGDISLKQDSEQISECGSPEFSKKSEHGNLGIDPTKSQSSGSKYNRRMQKTTMASSSLSPLSQSASSRRIFRHGNQGNNQAKSPASFPEASGIKVYRKTQNTMHNTSSNPSSLSRSQYSRRTFKHTDNGNRLIASLKPSPFPSGIKVKRQMQHTIHSFPSSSSLPSATESPISAPNSSQGKQDDGAALKRNKTGNQHPGETVKVGFKIRPKMGATGGAGDKVISARKLNFRRGKVIELQPRNNVSLPRRLKFRPARLLSDSEREKIENRKWIRKWKEADKGESNDAKTKSENDLLRVQTVERSKRRNFGRKVLDGSKVDGSASGSQQVVLRHQNLLGKQVTRRLYNNVIEETATKLAELRKSKVKALVGAFETVISLDSPGRVATPT